MNFISKSYEDTYNLGMTVAKNLKDIRIICLYGDLGSGKTTFTNGFINYFLPGKRVLSPTFIIVRHYKLDGFFYKHIYHIDLYRLDSTDEIKNLGLKEWFEDKNCLVIIEWPEKLRNLRPVRRTDIYFNFTRENINMRKIVSSNYG